MDENMESLGEIRRLNPEVVHIMDDILHSNKIPAVVKVRITLYRPNTKTLKTLKALKVREEKWINTI